MAHGSEPSGANKTPPHSGLRKNLVIGGTRLPGYAIWLLWTIFDRSGCASVSLGGEFGIRASSAGSQPRGAPTIVGHAAALPHSPLRLLTNALRP